MHGISPHKTGRGMLWHARFEPALHRFRYPSAMVLLDLDRLDTLVGTRLRVNRRGILSFYSTRHLIDDNHPNGDQARDWVRAKLHCDVSGPVLLLTNPHIFGVGFNPLSVYFLHDHKGAPSALIYEVSNTPWNEIHRYAVDALSVADDQMFEFRKTFHVSPFNPMDQVYQTRVQWPVGDTLSVYLALRDAQASKPMFEAGLSLVLTTFDRPGLKPLLLGFWPQTFVVLGGIYRQAFALWRKGVPYHSHP